MRVSLQQRAALVKSTEVKEDLHQRGQTAEKLRGELSFRYTENQHLFYKVEIKERGGELSSAHFWK